ncbi:hypothetical protein [Brenneria tiliae]|uniref:Uncharacterized protein n=1 Tax=Brenneria tiliae TaxID=2914984 RepID=A0ABT0MS93_9GAMM|nr:hypothetical protein [Brenneria tiliae]MCL2892696.1 hypothetical protein [Brenneria tiliae]MCL2899748.1 hypothetical protein [Brenneria tiliae]MCL2904126.1 hypothetical protein [Brenneria tiliae]
MFDKVSLRVLLSIWWTIGTLSFGVIPDVMSEFICNQQRNHNQLNEQR